MNKFTYSRSSDVATAIQDYGSQNQSKFIAGGTNILDLIKENIERPDHLVDINRLPLKEITENPDGGLRLGALVSNAETAYHEQVENRYPLLSKAILAGASAQLRNMATNGGNLFQRTRCYYFYDTGTPCNKREPNSGCSAINGLNRIHAILGTSDQCIAVHPSDMCVALAALNAKVNIETSEGNKTIDFADFHRLPGDRPNLDNNLMPGDLVTSIDLPNEKFKHVFYLKLRDRQSYAFALVSVAAALDLDGDIIKDIRLALGGVAHKPWRDKEAEKMLIGKTATKENFQLLAETVLQNAKGYGQNTFKIELAKRAIIRAFTEAAKTVTA